MSPRGDFVAARVFRFMSLGFRVLDFGLRVSLLELTMGLGFRDCGFVILLVLLTSSFGTVLVLVVPS